MFKFYGTVRVEPRFMCLICDPELARYYRHLAEKDGVILIKQRLDSHISVIRTEEIPAFQTLPLKYQNEVVEVFGNPEYIQNNQTHYWFRIISPRLEDIRSELGFSNQPAEIVDGKIITHPFHFTFGRIKQ